MKNGWPTKRLGDLCELVTKGTTPTSIGHAFAQSGINFVKVESIATTGQFIEDKLARITPECHSALRRSQLKAGDILFSIAGALGRTAFVTDDILPANTNQALAIIRLRRDPSVSPKFVLKALATGVVLEQIEKFKGGVAQQNLSLAQVQDFEIALPPLTQQQRIVAILDEAFDGIATAKANAEKNLQNAHGLFESHLRSVFTQRGKGDAEGKEDAKSQRRSFRQDGSPTVVEDAEMARLNAGYVTRTGGRDATLRHIPGDLSLAVGMPTTGANKGWRWAALRSLARLESGHTPSRKHPEYWGGSIPWIGIQDARENHGRRIANTIQKTNELGIANSSARVLPENTVCLSRTASVGYVVVMGRPMATSQDFVNWVCSTKLIPDFLKYLFLAEGRAGLLRFASGAVHQTIYFPEAKAFYVCYPDTEEQERIVRQCDDLAVETERLANLYEQKLTGLEALKRSFLHHAFAGNL
jgi:type I restriction enzyme, S subunit